MGGGKRSRKISQKQEERIKMAMNAAKKWMVARTVQNTWWVGESHKLDLPQF